VSSALHWAHNPNVPQYEYDVAKANQLLDAAGYPRGADGIRFRTRIYGNPGVRAILSEILKEQFKAVGIAAQVTIQEWASYAHAFRIARDIDGVFTVFSSPTVPDPITDANRYHSSQIKPGGQNYLLYKNPRVDAILDEVQAVRDQKQRAQFFYEYQDILAREVPMVPLYTLTGVDIWNKKFTGFGVTQWGGGVITFLEKVRQQ
jgi:peptide/nickel transport system substrate-binding protein